MATHTNKKKLNLSQKTDECYEETLIYKEGYVIEMIKNVKKKISFNSLYICNAFE